MITHILQQCYRKERLPRAEDKWLALMESLRGIAPIYLDVAQLIKHYFGLRNTAEYTKRNITLLYLFWEPENISKFYLFQKHRDELHEFANSVANTSIRFVYQSYAELWSEWIAEGIFETHVKKLQARYTIKLERIVFNLTDSIWSIQLNQPVGFGIQISMSYLRFACGWNILNGYGLLDFYRY